MRAKIYEYTTKYSE